MTTQRRMAPGIVAAVALCLVLAAATVGLTRAAMVAGRTLGHGATVAYVALAWPAEDVSRLLDTYTRPGALNGLGVPGRTPRRSHASRTAQVVGWRQWISAPTALRYTALMAHTRHARMTRALMIFGYPGILLLLGLFVLYGRATRWRTLRASDAHGGARFATTPEVRAARPRRGELPFVLGKVGRRWVAVRERHQYQGTLVVAPTGLGKSRGFIIPNVLRETGRRAIVAVDPKGEIHTVAARYLRAIGVDVQRVDFFGIGEDLRRYDPVARATTPAAALQFAYTWIENTRRGEVGEDSFWDDTVVLLIQATILHLHSRYADRGGATLVKLAATLATITPRALATEFAASVPVARQAAEGFLKRIEGNERLQSSIFTGLPLRFTALQDARIAAATTDVHQAPLDLSALGKTKDADGKPTKPVALFIVVPQGYERVVRPLTACLFSQLFQESVDVASASRGRRLPRPVHLYLDEAGSIGKIYQLPDWLSVVRSIRMSATIVVQTMAQLDIIYGATWRTVINAAEYTTVAIGGMEFSDAEWVSKRLGERTVLQGSAAETRKRGSLRAEQGNTSSSESGRPLLYPYELEGMAPGQAVVLRRQHRPLRVRLVEWDARDSDVRRRGTPIEGPYSPDRAVAGGLSTALTERDKSPALRDASSIVGWLGHGGERDWTPEAAPVPARPVYVVDWEVD